MRVPNAQDGVMCAPLCNDGGIQVRGPRTCIPNTSNAFPQALLDIPKPPDALYVIGNPDALREGISIVGARKATPYGKGCARKFGRIAATVGVTVISGGALGCDTEAHLGALDAGGTTVVFLGGGCDCLYPKRNAPMFQRIVDAGGCIVSEREWAVPPLPWMFRERNRLIAGLAKATLVVEAGLPSGTFSTADEALAAGKDVLAVPGSITSPTSSGANRLIAQGAYPIVDEDSLESALHTLFGTLMHGDSTAERDIPDDPIVEALMANPMRMDEILSAGLCDDPFKLPSILAAYERDGLVARYPDGRYGPSQAWVVRS